jgi:hypothetical protein
VTDPLVVALDVDERKTLDVLIDDEMWKLTRRMNDHYAAIDDLAIKRGALAAVRDKLFEEQS